MVICPGGGYNILAIEHEGTEVAAWLNSIGVTGVVLKYRVPRRKDLEKHDAPLQDVHSAPSASCGIMGKSGGWIPSGLVSLVSRRAATCPQRR